MVGIRRRYGKKSPRSGVWGGKWKKESTFNTPKYFILATTLFLALIYSGTVRYLRTRNGIASNDDTVKRNRTAAIRSTTTLDYYIPADANTHVKDVGAQMKDNDTIIPDANVVVGSSDDSISLDYDPNINEVILTQAIFVSAPPIREDVDLSQCLTSPLDVSIKDTITAGWGCDVFETAFYDPEINMTKVGRIVCTTHNNSCYVSVCLLTYVFYFYRCIYLKRWGKGIFGLYLLERFMIKMLH